MYCHTFNHIQSDCLLIFPVETFPCRFHQTMIFGHHINELWAVMNQIISWIVIFRLSITTRIISVTCVSNIFCSNQNSRCIWKSMGNKSILFVINANYQVDFSKNVLWHYRLWSFKEKDTKLERFLPKNQHTVFPHIVSSLEWFSHIYVLWPLITVHKTAETIQGRKLFKGRNYSRKYSNYGNTGCGVFKSGVQN